MTLSERRLEQDSPRHRSQPLNSIILREDGVLAQAVGERFAQVSKEDELHQHGTRAQNLWDSKSNASEPSGGMERSREKQLSSILYKRLRFRALWVPELAMNSADWHALTHFLYVKIKYTRG